MTPQRGNWQLSGSGNAAAKECHLVEKIGAGDKGYSGNILNFLQYLVDYMIQLRVKMPVFFIHRKNNRLQNANFLMFTVF